MWWQPLNGARFTVLHFSPYSAVLDDARFALSRQNRKRIEKIICAHILFFFKPIQERVSFRRTFPFQEKVAFTIREMDSLF